MMDAKNGDRTVWLVGVGMGNRATMTGEALSALEKADCLIGAGRMLEGFSDFPAPKKALVAPGEIVSFLLGHPEYRAAAVLLSGDVGFYSGATRLRPMLEGAGFRAEGIAGVSSAVYFCAKLGVPWEDAFLASAHGRPFSIASALAVHPKVFALTGGERTPAALCAELAGAGMGDAKAAVGERLSYPEETITRGTARELAARDFDPLSVLLVERPAAAPFPAGGIEDAEFVRGGAPMTKFEVRSVSVAKLRVRETDIVWDVGAGTGSVSVELARAARLGTVYAVEKNPEALPLLEENRRRFGAWNLRIVPGEAPGALAALPAPDRVFVGGSSGGLLEILRTAKEKNPGVRAVVNTVTLETLAEAVPALKACGFPEPDVVQLSAARARKAGNYHLMTGQNPVFILSAGGETDA